MEEKVAFASISVRGYCFDVYFVEMSNSYRVFDVGTGKYTNVMNATAAFEYAVKTGARYLRESSEEVETVAQKM